LSDSYADAGDDCGCGYSCQMYNQIAHGQSAGGRLELMEAVVPSVAKSAAERDQATRSADFVTTILRAFSNYMVPNGGSPSSFSVANGRATITTTPHTLEETGIIPSVVVLGQDNGPVRSMMADLSNNKMMMIVDGEESSTRSRLPSEVVQRLMSYIDESTETLARKASETGMLKDEAWMEDFVAPLHWLKNQVRDMEDKTTLMSAEDYSAEEETIKSMVNDIVAIPSQLQKMKKEEAPKRFLAAEEKKEEKKLDAADEDLLLIKTAKKNIYLTRSKAQALLEEKNILEKIGAQ